MKQLFRFKKKIKKGANNYGPKEVSVFHSWSFRQYSLDQGLRYSSFIKIVTFNCEGKVKTAQDIQPTCCLATQKKLGHTFI